MLTYTVKISIRDIVEMDPNFPVGYGTVILLDERLAKQDAPHVGTFLSEHMWRQRIFKHYESISSTFDATNSVHIYTFRLRGSSENS